MECCIKASLSNAGDVFDLLNFARNRVSGLQNCSIKCVISCKIFSTAVLFM